MAFCSCIQLWLWLSAFATLAGWTLSATGELTRPGYLIAFFIFLAFIMAVCGKTTLNPKGHLLYARKCFHQLRRPLPFCFGIFAILIFASGLIYAPDNYTGLTYRVGRVLQWLSHDHWIWIHTPDYRMNDRACGMEWMMTPLLLFTNSTRALFLLNFLPLLLLPGLVFSVFTRLGVHSRVAWQWMWLLPTGYDFLLQAGSIANDTFPAVYALAAIDYALRAAKSKKISDTAHSILAAALLIGAKASNLPLLLPWAILMLPLLPVLWRKVHLTIPVLLLAAAVSFLPSAILNSKYCGDWSGATLEPPIMTVHNPLIAVTGNVFQLLLQNLCPPLFPLAGWWNTHAAKLFPAVLAHISQHFDTGFFQLGELPTEDSAGIGIGLSVLLAVSLAAKIFLRSAPRSSSSIFRLLILLSPWVALLAYCSKSGMTTAARLIAPYYPLLLPLLLVGAVVPRLVRSRGWQVLVYLNLFLALIVLVLTPDRPLWPAKTVLSGLTARHPGSPLLARAFDVYSVYSKRPDPLADVRVLLPPQAQSVGFIGTSDDCDFSIWLPLGSRRVENFFLDDPPQLFRDQQIEYVVVGGLNLKYHQTNLEDWIKTNGAQLVATTNATLKVTEGPQQWYVVRMPAD
ncbi:MAG TPA: hypothetical protein VGN23_00345 [Verrucomicrobiae bacterium]|jgi:hypothetical protein